MFKKLAVSFLLLIPFMGSGQTPINVDKIIAKVDNYYILRSEVESLQLRAKQQSQAFDKCQGLESLVIQKLMVAKAEIDSVVVEEKDIQSQLDARMQQMIQLYGGEKNIVDQFGKTLTTLKSEVRQQVKEQLTAQKMQSTITEKTKITPAEVKKFFSQIPKDSLPYVPTEVTVAQLVRYAKVTKAQKDELYNRLRSYKTRVEAGEKFEDLAKEYSEDPGSRTYGGDLGWAKRGQMVPTFEAAAMKMKPNEMSDVVESDFGYHLIQTLEVRGQEYHARHILLRPEYNRMDNEEPRRFLDSLRREIVRDSIKFEKATKLYSEDKQTQDAGGVLMDPQTGSTMMALDQTMEPTLYFTLDTMKLGTISAVMPYRSEDGKTGVRILLYKAKKEPHRISLKEDYQKLAEYALMEKKNREVDAWFRKAIAEVYIKIEPEYDGCNILKRNP